MVDNTAAKNHLNQIESKLNDITKPGQINDIISARSLDLFRNLSSENLYIDADIIGNLTAIENRLQAGTGLSTHAAGREVYLDAQIAALPTNPGTATARANLIDERNKVHEINASGNLTPRHDEYLNLLNYAQHFNIGGPELENLDINTSNVAASAKNNIEIKSRFMRGTTNPDKYVLCGETGNEISEIPTTPSTFKLTIGGQEYTLSGIRLNGNNLDCSAMTINPSLKDSPQEITLSINAVFNSSTIGVRNVNVVYNKKFKLKLENGTTLLSRNSRRTAFEDYNKGGTGGTLTIIDDFLKTELDEEQSGGKQKIQRRAIEKALRHDGGTLYDTLTDSQKSQFLEEVLSDASIIDFAAIRTTSLKYGDFRNWFIEDLKSRNKDKNIIESKGKYKAFIHNNLPQKLDEFISDILDKELQKDAKNTKLKGRLTDFMDKIEKNRMDDDLNRRVGGNLDRKSTKKLYKMDRGPRSPFQNRDTNYMRFFAGSSTELSNQKVNIYTKLGEAEPVKYDLKMNISGKNNIVAEIRIDGIKDPIRLSSGEPTSLVRRILREQKIKYGKVRAHIGYNIYKAMIQLAKEKNFSLQYRRKDGTRFIDLDGDNIVVRRVRDLTTMNRDQDIITFEQQKFENSNKFGGLSDNALEQGLLEIGKHFNFAMNQIHKQYRKGVEKKFGTLINSRSRMRLPTSFWFSPIKKILNRKDVTDFDFDTTVNSNGKAININFSKNKFTVSMEGLDKSIESRDLGKILNKRRKKTRIFDGMERDIVEGIYIALVNKLRENGKIASTDFGVKDDVTGNMYVLNKDGRFGMIPKEDLKSQGNPMIGPRRKESGILNRQKLDKNSLVLFEKGSTEERELMKNPLLMQKFMKTMNRRMGLGGSIAAMFN